MKGAAADVILTSTAQGGIFPHEMHQIGGLLDPSHLIFADEKVNEEALEPSPSVAEIDHTHQDFKLIDLAALVTMKLTSYRDKDRVHLRDMMEIGQLDETWLSQVPPSLRQRLQDLLNDPDG